MSEGFPDRLQLPDGALYSERYPMAMAFAALQHAAQERQGRWRTPYIAHPVAVSILVWQYADPTGLHREDLLEDLAIAALLHDVAEDAGGQQALQEIGALFGDRVAEIVDRCSDELPPSGRQRSPWRQRKERYIAAIGRLADPQSPVADPGSCLVIACDKLHNLSETAADYAAQGDAGLERRSGGPDGQRWYYRSLRDALAPGVPQPLLADLDRQLVAIGG